MRGIKTLDNVERAHERIFVLDPDPTLLSANRSFRDTFAAAPEDTVGRRLCEIGNRVDGRWLVARKL